MAQLRITVIRQSSDGSVVVRMRCARSSATETVGISLEALRGRRSARAVSQLHLRGPEERLARVRSGSAAERPCPAKRLDRQRRPPVSFHSPWASSHDGSAKSMTLCGPSARHRASLRSRVLPSPLPEREPCGGEQALVCAGFAELSRELDGTIETERTLARWGRRVRRGCTPSAHSRRFPGLAGDGRFPHRSAAHTMDSTHGDEPVAFRATASPSLPMGDGPFMRCEGRHRSAQGRDRRAARSVRQRKIHALEHLGGLDRATGGRLLFGDRI